MYCSIKKSPDSNDIDFYILKAEDSISFTADEIIIIIDAFSLSEGKHKIATPQKANAVFACCGAKYTVENILGIPTVEDWYHEELLPKKQMLGLLLSE